MANTISVSAWRCCGDRFECLWARDISDFSNVLSKSTIERLAEADEFEVVREVQVFHRPRFPVRISEYQYQEYFADFAPLLPCLFSINHTPTRDRPLYGSSPNVWDSGALERSVQGILAVLLSLKKKPVIRYEKMSGMAKKLANEVQVNDPTNSMGGSR